MLLDLTGKEKVDRLPFLISGAGNSQLLEVPKLERRTGEAQACAVASAVERWNLADRVVRLCFDTTSSNTGRFNGACVLLEQHFQKNLLHFACRHHIFKIILRSVFEECMGCTSDTDVLVFKRFSNFWENLDLLQYDFFSADNELYEALETEAEAIICFAKNQLEKSLPRDDYRGLLELTIIFYGETPLRGVSFRVSGPIHNARRMSKAIYSLKVWLFRKQFALNSQETVGLRAACIFICKVYVKTWFKASLPTFAAKNDLDLIKPLVNHKNINQKISEVTCYKFKEHTWYLSEELVAMTFFDKRIPDSQKRVMSEATRINHGLPKPSKRCLQQKFDNILKYEIKDFVTSNSLTLFYTLKIKPDFLNMDPALWYNRQDYRDAVMVIKNLKVVNDNAERAVALIQDFSRTITKNEK